MSLPRQLLDRLAPVLGQAAADQVVSAVAPDRCAAVLALLGEVEDCSQKVARATIEALPELHRRDVLDQMVRWLDLAVALAAASGAVALKYCAESPVILSLIPPDRREPVLRWAIELADPDTGTAGAALEFFRGAAELSAVVPADAAALARWAEAGLDLCRRDYVLGIEFFRQMPAIAQILSGSDLQPWIAVGLKLITRNSLGKPDYLGTLEWFRTSPGLLAPLEPSVRERLISMCAALADRSPETAVVALAEAPALLSRMPTPWRLTVLRHGLLVAECDAEAAMHYLRRSPELVELIGIEADPDADPHSETCAAFERWFRTGMEVLTYSTEGGRSYFAFETRAALASIEEAMTGVPLRQVARTLKLFAQALSGRDVGIEPVSGLQTIRAHVSPDGRTIGLPPMLRRYPTREQNLRLYTVMTAHEAGHLEYGTYTLELRHLDDLMRAVGARYEVEAGKPLTLAALFERYPQPRLMQDLWTVLEDARVEFRLRHDYPGLSEDLARLAREAVATRSLRHGFSVRELAVDTLLLLSTAEPGTLPVPEAIQDLIDPAWRWCQTILTPTATAEDVVRLADRIYVWLETAVGRPPADQAMRSEATSTDQGLGPQAAEAQSAEYQPVTNWAYRGEMDPRLIRREQGVIDRREDGPQHAAVGTEVAPSSVVERFLGVERWEEPESRPDPEAVRASDARAHAVYPEWDGAIGDYRGGWCQVRERRPQDGTEEFAAAVRAQHGPLIRLLRRYFESLRPEGWRRLHGRLDGDEIDLDAAIRRAVERKAGVDPSDRLYLHREKRERSVAAAFLIDLSGSTSRQIGRARRRIIDVEREGLVLLAEALEAAGDRFAVYGYSGTGRSDVQVWVMKEFGERSSQLAGRIGAMAPLQQNRDGAAIRHATRKLLAEQAKIRLLVLLSDGRPLDDGYAGEYSLEDTKMALREARDRGVEPFCITVDHEADQYVRRMHRDVQTLVVDEIETLPAKLPRIYQRLTT